jgi:hypothetical protein
MRARCYIHTSLDSSTGDCGGRIRPIIAEDDCGSHLQVYQCDTCHREFGEWRVYHLGRGVSEEPPQLDYDAWPGGPDPPAALMSHWRAFPRAAHNASRARRSVC